MRYRRPRTASLPRPETVTSGARIAPFLFVSAFCPHTQPAPIPLMAFDTFLP